MFKKSKSKVLVDEASEEDEVCWQQEHRGKVGSGFIQKLLFWALRVLDEMLCGTLRYNALKGNSSYFQSFLN